MKTKSEFKVGDRVRFHPEVISMVYKAKTRKKAKAERAIYTVVDVRIWREQLTSIFLPEPLPAMKELIAFLGGTIRRTEESTLVLIGNFYPEQKICIEGSSGEKTWLLSSYFELVK